MTDFSGMLAEFKRWYDSDSTVARLNAKMAAGTADYYDANHYARTIGQKWSQMLRANYGNADNLNLVTADIAQALTNGYYDSANFANAIVSGQNASAGISFDAIYPKIDETRISGLLDQLIALKPVETVLDDSTLENLARSAVTDTIKANARLQKKAGLGSWIERKGWNCCDWCRSMSGRYTYGEQPEDFFRVHKDCTCVIEFHPAKYKAERISYYTDEEGKRHKVTDTM